MQITRQFAKFVDSLKYDELPADVVQAAKERILDNLGAAVAGYCNWEFRENLLKACAQLGEGKCSVIGRSERKYPAARAAMINATFAQANELDDGHIFAGVHAGCVIVSTAFVIGSIAGNSGKEIIKAVVAGYEIVYRLGVAMCPHLILKGFHPTSALDACGAVAVTSMLLGLSEEQIVNGIGMAGLYGSGLMEATISGQQSKCIMSGNAAATGVMAAYFAQNGIIGTHSVFEGPKGLFNAMSQDVDTERVIKGLGEEYNICNTYSKFYPTCRHGQAAIEACLVLLEEYKFNYKEVTSIHVGTYQVAIDLMGKIYEPKNEGEAKYSIPYGIALSLITGEFAPQYFKTEYFTQSRYLDFAAKVDVILDEDMQTAYPEQRGAKVKIYLSNGKCLEKTIFHLKGSPENPADLEALEKKFILNCKPLLGHQSARTIMERIQNIQSEKNIANLYEKFCTHKVPL